MTVYTQDEKDDIRALLLGRVEKVSDNELRLDNGTVLFMEGNEGGCSCGAGDYELTELNGVDNVITNVEFEDSPAGDNVEFEDSPAGDDEFGDGHYRIFVFADNVRVNLATFTGNNGNGYYGTGYHIEVKS